MGTPARKAKVGTQGLMLYYTTRWRHLAIRRRLELNTYTLYLNTRIIVGLGGIRVVYLPK